MNHNTKNQRRQTDTIIVYNLHSRNRYFIPWIPDKEYSDSEITKAINIFHGEFVYSLFHIPGKNNFVEICLFRNVLNFVYKILINKMSLYHQMDDIKKIFEMWKTYLRNA